LNFSLLSLTQPAVTGVRTGLRKTLDCMREQSSLHISRRRLRMLLVCETYQLDRNGFSHCRAACAGRNKRSALRRMETGETGGTGGTGILGDVGLRYANPTCKTAADGPICLATLPLRSESFVKHAG
jgi:hypothetical protein